MNILFFDTETTGLIKNPIAPVTMQPHVIEFCGIATDEKGGRERVLQFLARPPVRLDAKITEITGYTDAILAKEQPFNENAEKLREFIQSADCIVAHNLKFDMRMLSFEFRRLGYVAGKWPAKKICTVEATEWIKGRRLTLSQLHEHLFEEGIVDAHKAENDVRAMMRCFFELVKQGRIVL